MTGSDAARSWAVSDERWWRFASGGFFICAIFEEFFFSALFCWLGTILHDDPFNCYASSQGLLVAHTPPLASAHAPTRPHFVRILSAVQVHVQHVLVVFVFPTSSTPPRGPGVQLIIPTHGARHWVFTMRTVYLFRFHSGAIDRSSVGANKSHHGGGDNLLVPARPPSVYVYLFCAHFFLNFITHVFVLTANRSLIY